MKNIWLKKREINDFKKRKQYIHEILSPTTKISSPLVNCIIWKSDFSCSKFFQKYKVEFVYLFVKYLTMFNNELPSIVKIDFTFDNKAIVNENGTEELWDVKYEDVILCSNWTEDDILSHLFALDPHVELCQKLAKECAAEIKRNILADIEMLKTNDIFEYNYYINLFKAEKVSESIEAIKIRHAKVVVLK